MDADALGASVKFNHENISARILEFPTTLGSGVLMWIAKNPFGMVPF